jgi:hypothetical protein
MAKHIRAFMTPASLGKDAEVIELQFEVGNNEQSFAPPVPYWQGYRIDAKGGWIPENRKVSSDDAELSPFTRTKEATNESSSAVAATRERQHQESVRDSTPAVANERPKGAMWHVEADPVKAEVERAFATCNRADRADLFARVRGIIRGS